MKCPKSCGMCKPAPQQPKLRRPTCIDKYAQCPGWANAGECKKNPAGMSGYCPKSCGICKPAPQHAQPKPQPQRPQPQRPQPQRPQPQAQHLPRQGQLQRLEKAKARERGVAKILKMQENMKKDAQKKGKDVNSAEG